MWALTSSFEGVFSLEPEGKVTPMPSSRGDQSSVEKAVKAFFSPKSALFWSVIGEIALLGVGKTFDVGDGSIDGTAALI